MKLGGLGVLAGAAAYFALGMAMPKQTAEDEPQQQGFQTGDVVFASGLEGDFKQFNGKEGVVQGLAEQPDANGNAQYRVQFDFVEEPVTIPVANLAMDDEQDLEETPEEPAEEVAEESHGEHIDMN